MHNKQIEELLAEYMEKFGKDLNEQERRTGDELFMWLRDKLGTETTTMNISAESLSLCKSCYCMTKTVEGKCGKCGARKIDVQATEQRLLKIIEAGEEERGETLPTQTWSEDKLKNQTWEDEFHRLFDPEKTNGFENGVKTLDAYQSQAIKSFIRQELKAAVAKSKYQSYQEGYRDGLKECGQEDRYGLRTKTSALEESTL